ncbi:hypothetical protein BH18CHL2_BH18CHL2_13450 [soil metagenome]
MQDKEDADAAGPDPTKSVADEIERRQEKGMPSTDTPDVEAHGGAPSSKSEAESDKSWSRAAGEVQDEQVKRKGTAPEEP